MTIERLEFSQVRNLRPQSFLPHPRLNLLYGDNGSGKTSVLEALHLLGLGRSFRSGKIRRLINDSASECYVTALFLGGQRAGVRKLADSSSEMRLNGRSDVTVAELALQLPLQLLNPEVMDLLDGGSKPRRALLDWGVFHVEHRFFPLWQRYQRALKQRNSLLRNGTIKRSELRPWHVEMAEAASVIHEFRQTYVDGLQPHVQTCFKGFLPDLELELDYLPGWNVSEHLLQMLDETWERDIARGHTQLGPHRADLRIRVNGVVADEILSRGQKKLTVCALKLAQVARLRAAGHECTVLVDDLASELDSGARQRLCNYLVELGGQVFITCIEPATVVPALGGNPFKMFHVEHGELQEVAFSGVLTPQTPETGQKTQ
jgi:DNA replication and repair protein RecF